MLLFRVVLGIALLTLTACGDTLAASFPSLFGTASPTVTVGADTITLFNGGTLPFSVIDAAIAHAQRSVDVEMYEFGRHQETDQLVAAHRRGVTVTVIVDPSVGVSAQTEGILRSDGVTVYEYPVRSTMIDHVKLMVVDEEMAMIGGINWGTESPNNHDFDAEVIGPTAQNLTAVFARDVVASGGSIPIPSRVPTSIPVMTTLPGMDIRPRALSLIDDARHSITTALYVLTDMGIVHALERAAARGVTVRVVLDPTQTSSDAAEAELSGDGIDVRWYRPTAGELLHAKAISVDDRNFLFGSCNWSISGFENNHELDIEIDDSPSLASWMAHAIAADWAAAG